MIDESDNERYNYNILLVLYYTRVKVGSSLHDDASKGTVCIFRPLSDQSINYNKFTELIYGECIVEINYCCLLLRLETRISVMFVILN